MADLREIIREALVNTWKFPCDHDDLYKDFGIVCPGHETDSILAAIEAAGFRLLPSGGEVKEQWAVRWHLVGGGVDEQDCYRNARETAEQRARRLAARPPMGVERGEALMRRIYTGPWSPVLSDNSEGGSGA